MGLKSLLLDNQSTKQTVFKNTFWLFVSRGIGFLDLLLIIFVARALGPTDYGSFSFAWSVVSIFAAIVVFGLPEIVTREFSRKEDLEKEFPSILSLRALLSLGAAVVMFGSSFLLTGDPQVRALIWLLAIYVLLRDFGGTLYAVFRARQKMEYEAWMQILLTVCSFVFVGLVLVFYPSIANIGAGYLMGSLVALVGILVFFSLKIGALRIGWDREVWKKFFSFSWPLGLTAAFAAVYLFMDSVIMGVLGQTTQVGWYNAAYKIANITLIPMSIISISFYPVLSKYYEESGESFQKFWTTFLKVMLVIATPLVLGVIIFAPQIINLVYGEAYAPSVPALRILMVMVGLWFVSTPFIRALVISNQQIKVLVLSALGAFLNIILNLVLIPRYSLSGAAVATAATYFLILILAVILVFKNRVLEPS